MLPLAVWVLLLFFFFLEEEEEEEVVVVVRGGGGCQPLESLPRLTRSDPGGHSYPCMCAHWV